jgi:hypothetical protein
LMFLFRPKLMLSRTRLIFLPRNRSMVLFITKIMLQLRTSLKFRIS